MGEREVRPRVTRPDGRNALAGFAVTSGVNRVALPFRLFVHTLLFSDVELRNFLRTVARTSVTARHIHTEWMRKSDDEDWMVGVILRIPPFRIPLVDPGPTGQLVEESHAEFERLLTQFASAAKSNPNAIVAFLNECETQLGSATEKIDSVYRTAGIATDRGRAWARGTAIALSKVRASATIALGIANVFAPAFLLSTGYDIALEIVDKWDEGKKAVLVGVVKVGGKDVVEHHIEHHIEEGLEVLSEENRWTSKLAREEIGQLERDIGQLEKTVEKLDMRYQGKIPPARLPEALRKLGKNRRELIVTEEAAVRAGRYGKVLGAAKVSAKWISCVLTGIEAVRHDSETVREALR
jgi:hypothetical protein